MKILSSFAIVNTGEGKRIAYTYSEFDKTGRPLSRNNKENALVMSDEVMANIEAIERFVSETYLTE